MACEVGVLNIKHTANSLPTFQQMKEELKSNLHAARCTFPHTITNLWVWGPGLLVCMASKHGELKVTVS
jgi:hypothetical protein